MKPVSTPSILRLLAAMFLATVCFSCQPAPQESNVPNPIVLTKDQKAMTSQANVFAWRLLHQIGANNESCLISPWSAATALAMTANGTDGQTLEQMREALGFGSFTLNALNHYFQTVTQALLHADNTTALSLANSVWAHSQFTVNDSFFNTLRSFYSADVYARNLSAAATLQEINAWCSLKTNGKIPTILEQLDAGMVMYLLNALFFQGTWTYQFDKSFSAPATFYAADATTQTMTAMHMTQELPFYTDDNVQIAELPYGNQSFSMVIVLPLDGKPLEKTMTKWDATQWDAWMKALQTTELSVTLPRFSFTYEADLIPALKALGMTLPFNASLADFSRLSPEEGLYIDLVKQKTYVEVTEEGTQAAAATVVGIRKKVNGATLEVNRPFLFAIRERSTGLILFLGKMNHL